MYTTTCSKNRVCSILGNTVCGEIFHKSFISKISWDNFSQIACKTAPRSNEDVEFRDFNFHNRAKKCKIRKNISPQKINQYMLLT